jgi:Rod binding domain-containing protein
MNMPIPPVISQASQFFQDSQADTRKMRQSAMDFEALLMRQILKSARSADSGGWLGGGEDQAGQSMVELGEEYLAQVLAAEGGLGMARLISDGLRDQRLARD